jgi:metallo-beta-lactamase class B
MKRNLVMLGFCSFLFLAGWMTFKAQGQSGGAESHVAAAKALAYEPGHDFSGAFEAICVPPRPAAQRGGGGERGGAAGGRGAGPAAERRIPPRAQWYAEPAKIFDNLYYVGMKNDTVFALTTSGGIILLDSAEDYAVEAEVVEGLKKLGLDPASIKYNVVTASHTSSYGGAKFLQEHFNTQILLSEADWNVIEKAHVPAEVKPRKDMIVTDGQKLTLGDTTVTLYVTPGHTPGTVSMIVPLKDGNQRHVAALLGGRSPGAEEEGVQYFPTELDALKTWKASINCFMEIANKAGADVFLITRTQNDHLLDNIHALSYRKPGGPHPFVNKDAARRFLKMESECMDAQLAWRSSS